jgi:hypothetical protein
VVDQAIRLFASIFPFCTTKHKKQLLDHLASCVSKSKRAYAVNGSI